MGGVVYGFNRIHSALINVSFGIFVTLLLSIASFATSITYVSELRKSGVGQTLSDIRSSSINRIANNVATVIRLNDSNGASSPSTSNADEILKLSELKERGIISAEEFETQKKRLFEGQR
jgi:hypothetical protein